MKNEKALLTKTLMTLLYSHRKRILFSMGIDFCFFFFMMMNGCCSRRAHRRLKVFVKEKETLAFTCDLS